MPKTFDMSFSDPGRAYSVIKYLTCVMVVAIMLASIIPGALAQMHEGKDAVQMIPTLTVAGRGEASALPDRATVRLGATIQERDAAAAQKKLNEIMVRVLNQIKSMRVPDEKVATTGLSLLAVYNTENPKPGEAPVEPYVVAYRASNTIEVQVDDLNLVGQIIDAGVAAGANRLAGISFELKDDMKFREQALRLAVKEARAKAETIASAMDLRLLSVIDVVEGGGGPIPPQPHLARAFAAEAMTPVQPGQVLVEAAVTVRYRIAEGETRQ